MKKIIALLLAMLCLLSVFAGCGEEKKPEENENKNNRGEETVRTFDTPQQEALVVVAEAYLARRVYLQYDDTRFISGSPADPYRWERHTNAPEDSTRQFTCYTNCAAFTYDVYKEALGLDIIHWYTGALDKATDIQVFHHTITGKETAEEKAAIEQEFRGLLQVGDILCCRHDSSSGHAMLYVGDGQILHSSAPGGGNYNYNSNLEMAEPRGSIAYMTVDSLFQSGGDYYFFEEATFSICRPLMKYTDAQVTEETQNRINNLQNIYVEKLSSHSASQTADLGEEITFTFSVRNSGTKDATLAITDTVPENTTYVSGAEKADGNNLSWNLTVAVGETKEVSYTVKVKEDESLYGSYVYTDNSTVGGVTAKCRPVYIGKHLSADQMAAITAKTQTLSAGGKKGTDLAEKIYADAGITVAIEDAKSILEKLYGTGSGMKYLNTGSAYIEQVAPTMYGGYKVDHSDYFYNRTRGILAQQLYVGDIVLCMEGSKVQTYMYIGANKIIDLEKGEILDITKTRDALFSTLGYDVFAVIRPGAAL